MILHIWECDAMAMDDKQTYMSNQTSIYFNDFKLCHMKPRFNLLDQHTCSYEDARKKYVVVLQSS